MQAFWMNAIWIKNNNHALVWVERMKAQALKDRIHYKSEYNDLLELKNKSPLFKQLVNLLK